MTVNSLNSEITRVCMGENVLNLKAKLGDVNDIFAIIEREAVGKVF